MGAIPSHFDKVWITGGHEESTLAAICIVCIAHLAIISFDFECPPLLAYGEVNRGSIRVRKDPKDQQEWQFCLETAVVFSDKQSKHEMNMEAATKLEAIQWMEARKAGTMLSPEEGLAANALNDVLPTSAKKKAKELAAIKDKESDMKKVMQKMRKKIAKKYSMQLQRKLTSCQTWGVAKAKTSQPRES